MRLSVELYEEARREGERLRAVMAQIEAVRRTIAAFDRIRPCRQGAAPDDVAHRRSPIQLSLFPAAPSRGVDAMRRTLAGLLDRARQRSQKVATITATAQRYEQLEASHDRKRLAAEPCSEVQPVRKLRPSTPDQDSADAARKAKEAAEADFRKKWLSGRPRMARIADSPFGFCRHVNGSFGRGKRN